MSLLLDALKKSEAQRRRGKAAAVDLTTTPPSAGSARPRKRWPMLLLPVVLLAAAGPWLWPQLSSRLADGRVIDGVGNRTPAAHGEPKATTAMPATSPNATPRRAAPSPVAGAGRARKIETDEADVSETPAEASSEAPSMAQQQDPTEPLQPAVPALDVASDSKSVSAGAPQSRSERQRPSAAGSEAEPVANPEPNPEPNHEPEPNPEPRENFIRAWELPQARRGEFPDLKLTVHFYSEVPRDRFVLVNGERYSEGQQVEPGVKLAEIRRRGAVVEFADYRVLIE